MLKVKLTENYAGVSISGDYNDLNFLYDSIIYLLRKEPKNEIFDIMQKHLYGFLYDVRHAYQGQRYVKLEDNNLQEFTRNIYNLKKKDVTNNNLYFEFNYVLPDIILDIMLVKYFISKIDKKNNNIYNQYINMVTYFYSLVLDSLRNILSDIQFNKVKNGLLNSNISDKIFSKMWFEIITLDYLKMNKNQRKKEIMNILSAIYNYIYYDEYLNVKKSEQKKCKEYNCRLIDLRYGDYPDEIEW